MSFCLHELSLIVPIYTMSKIEKPECANLTAAVVATRGPATEPRALLNAKTELEGAGVAVTSEIHVCAVERALNFGVDSADWTYFW